MYHRAAVALRGRKQLQHAHRAMRLCAAAQRGGGVLGSNREAPPHAWPRLWSSHDHRERKVGVTEMVTEEIRLTIMIEEFGKTNT